jgi:DNA-binding Xre family transcriptional regulator
MGISYKKLWKLMIDRELLKKDLREGCSLSTVSMAKLAKNRDISTEVLARVCNFLRCDISDICEMILDDESTAKEKERRDDNDR